MSSELQLPTAPMVGLYPMPYLQLGELLKLLDCLLILLYCFLFELLQFLNR